MLRRAPCLLLALTACATTSSGPAGPTKDWKAEVMAAEARRDAFDPVIQAVLARPEPELRRAGLWALARIEEVGTASLAAAHLGAPEPEVAASAAFALGQIGGPEAQVALLAGLDRAAAPEAALRALSKVGTASVAPALVAKLSAKSPKVQAAAALALGLLKKRLKGLDASFAPPLVPLVAHPDRDVRFSAVYALARFGGPEAAVALVSALGDEDAEIRMWAAIGLGEAGANPTVFDAVMRDVDWRVRAATAKALGQMATVNPTEANRALGRLDALASQAFARLAKGDRLDAGRAMHVLFAAIAGAEAAGRDGRKILERLEQATWETENLPAAAGQDLARVQCAAAVALDRADGTARRIETCGKGAFAEWRRRSLWLELRAAAGGETATEQIAPFARNPDPRLRTAAVMALGALKTQASADALWSLLESNDPAVASAAVELLCDPSFAGLRPKAAPERLLEVVLRLAGQPDDSLVVGPIDALGHLGAEAKPLAGRVRALLEDPRPAVRRRAARLVTALTDEPVAFGPSRAPAPVVAPNPWPRDADLVLETERGQIVLRLDGGKAPRFAGTLVHLARAGFYDGLTFHRVVSTFVTQGGCPRGDGWGGPGYTVPGETSAARFERGAVGIATNGRDTGGSQLFVMHAYHPHLDGGYPWVGRVVEGIDVLDALQPDDRILRATVR